MANREIRSYFEAEPIDLLKAMDLGDTGSLAKYFEDMLQAVRDNIIHKHTAQSRLDEISAYAQVKHGIVAAKMLLDTQNKLNLIIPNTQYE